jgi:FkbH-like protein
MVPTDRDQIRHQIDAHLAAAEWVEARGALERLWDSYASAGLAGYVAMRFDRMREQLPFYRCRVAILRSFTVEPVVPLLRACAWVNRIELTAKVGEFNAYAQEVLDPESWVYRDDADAIILAIQTQDIAPALWDAYADAGPDEIRATVDRVLEDYRAWIRTLRSRTPAYILVHSLELPVRPSRGILDAQSFEGQAQAIRSINTGLRQIASEFSGVHIFDYDTLVASYGRGRWRDEQRWATVKLPMRADAMLPLADEWVRHLAPVAGRICKVLVTDLDNTLWGGVIGEDGISGIKIDREHPGIAYWNVQRALLDVKRRGVLLAISSKNHREDALEAFRVHPGMLLKHEDFAAERINWCDKPSCLREIAAELNMGLESLAFLDDNPAERERVRRETPEVTVIDLPADPMGFAEAVRRSPVLERLSISAEDAERSRYYAEQRVRAAALGSASNVEEFYRSLRQEVEIAPVNSATLARAAQLTQKTNQFNVTTRRYSEQRLAELAETAGWAVHTVRVKDRFGDNGLVGVMVTSTEGSVCEIDTFLLSCRVISRTIETAMLAFLAAATRSRGLTAVCGWFLPTAKNGPAADFYRKHGFQLCSTTEAGTLWSLDLSQVEVDCPDWIQLTVTEGSTLGKYVVSESRT